MTVCTVTSYLIQSTHTSKIRCELFGRLLFRLYVTHFVINIFPLVVFQSSIILRQFWIYTKGALDKNGTDKSCPCRFICLQMQTQKSRREKHQGENFFEKTWQMRFQQVCLSVVWINFAIWGRHSKRYLPVWWASSVTEKTLLQMIVHSSDIETKICIAVILHAIKTHQHKDHPSLKCVIFLTSAAV